MKESARIRELIKKGQLKEALEQADALLKSSTQKDFREVVTQLLAQFHLADANYKRGIMSPDDYARTIYRITNSFILELDNYSATEGDKTVRKGYLAHNIPNEMTIQKKMLCTIKISDIEEVLANKAGFRLEDTSFHLREITRVKLKGDTTAFAIAPLSSPLERALKEGETGDWKFYVTPLCEGVHDLIIHIEGLVSGKGLAKLERQVVEDAVINISVTTQAYDHVETFKKLPIQVSGESKKSILPFTTLEVKAMSARMIQSIKQLGSFGLGIFALLVLAALLAYWFLKPPEGKRDFSGSTTGTSVDNSTKDSTNIDTLVVRVTLPTSVSTGQGSVILRTDTSVFNFKIAIYDNENNPVPFTKVLPLPKTASVLEVQGLNLGSKYRFQIEGSNGNKQFMCSTLPTLITKAKQEETLACTQITSESTGEKPVQLKVQLAIKLKNYPKDCPLYGAKMLFKATSSDTTFTKDIELKDDTITTVVNTNKNGVFYSFEVSSSCVQCTGADTIRNSRLIVLNCAKIDSKHVDTTPRPNPPKICTVNLSKKSGFIKPMLYVDGKRVRMFKVNRGNITLFLTIKSPNKVIHFRVEDGNETCESQGVPPLSNTLNLDMNCKTRESKTTQYIISFKVDKQLKDSLLVLPVVWKRNGYIQERPFVKPNLAKNTVDVYIWDKKDNPTDLHELRLMLPRRLHNVQIGYFSKRPIQNATIDCTLCKSCPK